MLCLVSSNYRNEYECYIDSTKYLVDKRKGIERIWVGLADVEIVGKDKNGFEYVAGTMVDLEPILKEDLAYVDIASFKPIFDEDETLIGLYSDDEYLYLKYKGSLCRVGYCSYANAKKLGVVKQSSSLVALMNDTDLEDVSPMTLAVRLYINRNYFKSVDIDKQRHLIRRNADLVSYYYYNKVYDKLVEIDDYDGEFNVDILVNASDIKIYMQKNGIVSSDSESVFANVRFRDTSNSLLGDYLFFGNRRFCAEFIQDNSLVKVVQNSMQQLKEDARRIKRNLSMKTIEVYKGYLLAVKNTIGEF